MGPTGQECAPTWHAPRTGSDHPERPRSAALLHATQSRRQGAAPPGFTRLFLCTRGPPLGPEKAVLGSRGHCGSKHSRPSTENMRPHSEATSTGRPGSRLSTQLTHVRSSAGAGGSACIAQPAPCGPEASPYPVLPNAPPRRAGAHPDSASAALFPSGDKGSLGVTLAPFPELVLWLFLGLRAHRRLSPVRACRPRAASGCHGTAEVRVMRPRSCPQGWGTSPEATVQLARAGTGAGVQSGQPRQHRPCPHPPWTRR